MKWSLKRIAAPAKQNRMNPQNVAAIIKLRRTAGRNFMLHNVEAEWPEPAGRAKLKIYRQRSAASWRRSTRANG